jgi:DnaK suppressor protein
MSTTTSKYRQMLRAKALELAGSLRRRDEIAIEASAEEVEQVLLATQRDFAIQSIDRSTFLLREVNAALDRVAGGSFGRCEQCDSQIPEKRLNALPWARHCVACQEAMERNGASSFRSLSFAA